MADKGGRNSPPAEEQTDSQKGAGSSGTAGHGGQTGKHHDESQDHETGTEHLQSNPKAPLEESVEKKFTGKMQDETPAS